MKFPSYHRLLRLGRSIEPHIPKRMDLADMARLMGGTRQAMYNESLVVLGKVVWMIRKAFPDKD